MSLNTSTRTKLGLQGEEAVVQWLTAHNFIIREKNFTTRYGEIDIIAQKNELIVMVEVKTRKTEYFSLSQVITLTKQKKIVRTAKIYQLKHNLFEHVIRFDVATVIYTQNYLPPDDPFFKSTQDNFTIDYQENAFFADPWE